MRSWRRARALALVLIPIGIFLALTPLPEWIGRVTLNFGTGFALLAFVLWHNERD